MIGHWQLLLHFPFDYQNASMSERAMRPLLEFEVRQRDARACIIVRLGIKQNQKESNRKPFWRCSAQNGCQTE